MNINGQQDFRAEVNGPITVIDLEYGDAITIKRRSSDDNCRITILIVGEETSAEIVATPGHQGVQYGSGTLVKKMQVVS